MLCLTNRDILTRALTLWPSAILRSTSLRIITAKKIIFIALSEYHHDDILAKEILFISQRFHSELCLCYKQQQSGTHLVCGSCQLEAEERRLVGELLQTLISFPLSASRSHLTSHTHIHILILFITHLLSLSKNLDVDDWEFQMSRYLCLAPLIWGIV